MKKKGESFFWTSFSDLMTSLFFIMLVLYVLTYLMLKKKERELQNTVDDLKHKLEVYELVEQNLKPLKQDTLFFKYEEEYKRFSLAFEIKFVSGEAIINAASIESGNPESVINRIDSAGLKLKLIIDSLSYLKNHDSTMANVSYLLIISGYASHMLIDKEYDEYIRSYKRAWNLWSHWKELGIDFEANKYKGLIDLQIAGNGWGGVGRFPGYKNGKFDYINEEKNQRFIIQIIPKIGNTE